MGAIFAVAAGLLTLPILRHAFSRSVGTGLLVLLVPVYVAYFAVGQFEHPRKPLLVAAWFACLGIAAVCLGLHSTRVTFAELFGVPR